MEVQILNDEKDLLEVEIKGEGHTLCNALRSELWKLEDTSFASYNIKNPLISSPILALKVKKGKPKKLLLDAVESLRNKTKELKGLLSKVQ